MFEEVEQLQGVIAQALPGLRANPVGLCILADAIALARAETKAHEGKATRRDALAQLEAMTRLDDDRLILALRACDRRTLALIDGAQKQLIAEVISATGCFVDVDGEEYRLSPPGIQFAAHTQSGGYPIEVTIDIGASPLVVQMQSGRSPDIYLPAGIEGVRRAVFTTLEALRSEPERAGNRVKEWQRPLARSAVEALRAFQAKSAKVRVWRTDGTGRFAPVVTLVRIVFGFVGDEIKEARAFDLCKEILKKK